MTLKDKERSTLLQIEIAIQDTKVRLRVLEELAEKEQLLLSKLIIDRDILETADVLDEF